MIGDLRVAPPRSAVELRTGVDSMRWEAYYQQTIETDQVTVKPDLKRLKEQLKHAKDASWAGASD